MARDDASKAEQEMHFHACQSANDEFREHAILKLNGSICSATRTLGSICLLMAVPVLVGCHVPQPKGKGVIAHIVEPTTKRGYVLYKPESYVNASEAERKRRDWPLVVTFHGMKPFDIAWYQADEWQQEADRYGLIVVAPELKSASVLAEFPLDTPHPSFVKDEKASLAIMEHVYKTTNASRRHVLSTGFSSGGYMAHYMVNRHPEKFTALAPRQANFSRGVMNTSMAQRSRNHPILIMNTQNDFKICKEESKDAVSWYTKNGFSNMAWIYIKDLGHERTPDLAAAFFAQSAGLRPKHSASSVLVKRQAIDGNAAGLAILRGRASASRPMASTAVQQPAGDGSPMAAAEQAKPETRKTTEIRRTAKTRTTSETQQKPRAQRSAPQQQAPRSYVASRPPLNQQDSNGRASTRQRTYTQPPRDPAPRRTTSYASRPATQPSRTPVPATVTINERGGTPKLRRNPVSIRLSSAIGIEPLHLAYSAVCPADWYRTARFEWTLDGQPIEGNVNGHRTITRPGEYRLGLQIVTANGDEYRATRTLRVLPEIRASGLSSAR